MGLSAQVMEFIPTVQDGFMTALKDNVCLPFYVLLLLGGEVAKKIDLPVSTSIKIAVLGILGGVVAYFFGGCTNVFHIVFTFCFAIASYEFVFSKLKKLYDGFGIE